MPFQRHDLKSGRLVLPAQLSAKTKAPLGIRHLGLDNHRDAILFVPKNYHPKTPAPFALLLHGAGGSAEHGIFLLKHLAEDSNLILLAPSARNATWDMIVEEEFGRDVLFYFQGDGNGV